MITNIAAVQENMALRFRHKRCEQFDSPLVFSLHPAKAFCRMLCDLLDVYQSMMNITSEHEIA